jgi:hypothetical protein
MRHKIGRGREFANLRPSGEQFGAGGRELHVGPGFVQPKPA